MGESVSNVRKMGTMETLRVEKASEFSGSCWNGVQKQWLERFGVQGQRVETSGAGEAVRGDERGVKVPQCCD